MSASDDQRRGAVQRLAVRIRDQDRRAGRDPRFEDARREAVKTATRVERNTEK